MAIVASDLTGDAAATHIVLLLARDVAPCLDSLVDDDRDAAIAILNRCVADVPAAGSRRVRSQSRNGSSVSFTTGESVALPGMEKAALRALCGSVPAAGSTPVGRFPAPGTVVDAWPAEEYSS